MAPGSFSFLLLNRAGYGRGEGCEKPGVVMNTQIEHKDFAVLALDLVPRYMFSEA
jgi:hypothetical protein